MTYQKFNEAALLTAVGLDPANTVYGTTRLHPADGSGGPDAVLELRAEAVVIISPEQMPAVLAALSGTPKDQTITATGIEATTGVGETLNGRGL